MAVDVAGAFHPIFRELALRSRARRRALVAASVLVAAGACVAASAASLAPYADAFVVNPILAILVFAVPAYPAARAALTQFHDAIAHGWWAAMPVAPAARRRSAVAIASASYAPFAAAWLTAVALAPPRAGKPAVATIVLAAIGLAVGVAAARTRHRHAGRRRAQLAAPLTFARYTPRDRRVPHLPLWQRAVTAARWRSGGGASSLAAIALMMPMNTSARQGAAILLVVALAAWIFAMATASLQVHAKARVLLAATPAQPREIAAAALRYPLAAGAIAAVAALVVASTLVP